MDQSPKKYNRTLLASLSANPMLAMSGDLGGAAGPAIVGNISQVFSNNLKAGLLAGTIFPVVLIVMILLIPVITKKKEA